MDSTAKKTCIFFIKSEYCYDIAEQSTCFSDVTVECDSNVCVRGLNMRSRDFSRPVSYTHLDVYKRQTYKKVIVLSTKNHIVFYCI